MKWRWWCKIVLLTLMSVIGLLTTSALVGVAMRIAESTSDFGFEVPVFALATYVFAAAVWFGWCALDTWRNTQPVDEYDN